MRRLRSNHRLLACASSLATVLIVATGLISCDNRPIVGPSKAVLNLAQSAAIASHGAQRLPKLTDVNKCYIAVPKGPDAPGEFPFDSVSLPDAQGARSESAQATRFSYVRWSTPGRRKTQEVNCVVPLTKAAAEQAYQRFRIPNRPAIHRQARAIRGPADRSEHGQPDEARSPQWSEPQVVGPVEEQDQPESSATSPPSDPEIGFLANPAPLAPRMARGTARRVPRFGQVSHECVWWSYYGDFTCEEAFCEFTIKNGQIVFDCGNGCELAWDAIEGGFALGCEESGPWWPEGGWGGYAGGPGSAPVINVECNPSSIARADSVTCSASTTANSPW